MPRTSDSDDMKASVSRSKTEREADSFDCELFRLICRAETLYESVHHLNPRSHERSDAHELLYKLRSARPHIRAFMHTEDRART